MEVQYSIAVKDNPIILLLRRLILSLVAMNPPPPPHPPPPPPCAGQRHYCDFFALVLVNDLSKISTSLILCPPQTVTHPH
jgi:hypothetical protein